MVDESSQTSVIYETSVNDEKNASVKDDGKIKDKIKVKAVDETETRIQPLNFNPSVENPGRKRLKRNNPITTKSKKKLQLRDLESTDSITQNGSYLLQNLREVDKMFEKYVYCHVKTILNLEVKKVGFFYSIAVLQRIESSKVQELDDFTYLFPRSFISQALSELKKSNLDCEDFGTHYMRTPFGNVSLSVIQTMKVLWEKRQIVESVRDTITWCKGMGDKKTPMDENLIKILKTKNLSSITNIAGVEFCLTEILAFRYDNWLNDICIILPLKLFVMDGNKVQIISPALLAVLENEKQEDKKQKKTQVLEQLQKCHFFKDGFTVLPINVYNSHWTCILIDWEKQKIIHFDPLQKRTTYKILSDISKEILAEFLKPNYPKYTQERETKFTQTDGYNCGVYVIRFVQAYVTKMKNEEDAPKRKTEASPSNKSTSKKSSRKKSSPEKTPENIEQSKTSIQDIEQFRYRCFQNIIYKTTFVDIY
jgi:hypothetical protein